MAGRISLAAGLLLLLAPVLGAQTAATPVGGMPSFRLSVDGGSDAPASALGSLHYSRSADVPALVNLRFEPFTKEARQRAEIPRLAPLAARELPSCPMPVERVDSSHDPMPVAVPDSTVEYSILVVPPQCRVEAARSVSLPRVVSPADSTK
jgi:hypothetical protein